MEVKFRILYKSGHGDVIRQTASEEEIRGLNELITEGFRTGADGFLTFGDGEKHSHIVRLSAVERVWIEVVEGE